jgi:hypothetical protein
MHIITIAFGNAPAMWQFVFKTEEAANVAWTDLNTFPPEPGNYINITDDFGQSATFELSNICGRMIEDMDKSKLAHIARSLHQQRTQAEFQKAAEADPAIRSAMRGPAVLSPVPGMFNGRGN